MEIATLRQRAVELLNRGPWRRDEELSALPPYTGPLFRLAHIAVGDADSAAELVADVLASGSRGTYPDEALALRLLIQNLPTGWLSWPGAAGPAEWLRMRVRREQADRVLSVLGEWDAPARVALGLWLLWNIRRDELDAWLGTRGMGDRITEFVGYVGEGLDMVNKPGEQPSCPEVAPDLIDAHEPQVGRAVRLHTLGCEPCRRRAAGLRLTEQVLRNALDAFFRAPPPANLASRVARRRRDLRLVFNLPWQPLLIAVAALVFYVGVVRKPAATAAPLPPPVSATDLIDRALNRFSVTPPHDGVLHERVWLNDGGAHFLIERWYDYGPRERTRITVRRAESESPLLDLGFDGIGRVAYEVDTGMDPRRDALIRRDDLQQLAPLFRQLPAVGSFGDRIVPQRYLDINLLAAARRGNPTLLGTSRWRGRPAYTLMSTTNDGERMSLTVDQATLSLLEARLTPAVSGTVSPRRVWQAELVEVLPPKAIGRTTFELTAREEIMPLIDPRQFAALPTDYSDLETAAEVTPLPLPEVLPEDLVQAYLRHSNYSRSAIVQLYEGRWSTLAIAAPRRVEPWRYPRLDQSFAKGRFADVPHGLPETTIIEFVLNDQPGLRMRLYLWHALATDEERTALSRTLLESLTLVDRDNIERFRDRFVSPGSNEMTNGSSTARSRG